MSENKIIFLVLKALTGIVIVNKEVNEGKAYPSVQSILNYQSPLFLYANELSKKENYTEEEIDKLVNLIKENKDELAKISTELRESLKMQCHRNYESMDDLSKFNDYIKNLFNITL